MNGLWIWYIITVLAAYCIGSINFAVIFSKRFANVDVRDYGSGNAGATNVLRVTGKKAAIFTFVADAAKGAVAAGLGFLVFQSIYTRLGATNGVTEMYYTFSPSHGAFACGLACMIGHCWPIFFGFRGGKAVATSVGIFAVCCPPAIIIGLLGFAVLLLISKKVSLSSLFATVLVVGISIFCAFTGSFGTANPWFITVLALAAGIIVFLRHSSNIVRLINGTEKKISTKKEKKNG